MSQSPSSLDLVPWGYCQWCKFLVEVELPPLVTAGCLRPHAEGKYAPHSACSHQGRYPNPMPSGGVIASLARNDRITMAEIDSMDEDS